MPIQGATSIHRRHTHGQQRGYVGGAHLNNSLTQNITVGRDGIGTSTWLFEELSDSGDPPMGPHTELHIMNCPKRILDEGDLLKRLHGQTAHQQVG